jgi:hypothetical protein
LPTGNTAAPRVCEPLDTLQCASCLAARLNIGLGAQIHDDEGLDRIALRARRRQRTAF